jgi:acyl-coenzyme A synthetase/AMP-(fatty) acid ligase
MSIVTLMVLDSTGQACWLLAAFCSWWWLVQWHWWGGMVVVTGSGLAAGAAHYNYDDLLQDCTCALCAGTKCHHPNTSVVMAWFKT